MKPTDFIKEEHNLVQAATEMHTDHEIQMAREACYRSASNAIELHRMLKHISEQEGLEAWASEKISLANDYLRTVKEWLEYELMSRLEGRVAENNMEISEATKETTTGRVHKAEPGGYGRRDDDDGKKKEKAAEPVKRGRGRPKKDADSETGEVKNWDTDTLQSWIVGSVPKKLPGKASVKHKIKDESANLSENEFQDQFSSFLSDFKRKRGIGGGASAAAPTRSAAPVPAADTEQMMARLKELQARFDPAYEYSDDHAFWSKQNEIAKEIRSVKRTLAQQGVAEGSEQISIQVRKGRRKFATELSVDGKPAGAYQYDADSGRSIAEVYPEYKGKGFGKILVLHAIYTAAKLGMDFVEDESRTAEYDNVLDSLDSNGLAVNDDGYWYVTGEGEHFLKQRLKQGVAEGAGEQKYMAVYNKHIGNPSHINKPITSDGKVIYVTASSKEEARNKFVEIFNRGQVLSSFMGRFDVVPKDESGEQGVAEGWPDYDDNQYSLTDSTGKELTLLRGNTPEEAIERAKRLISSNEKLLATFGLVKLTPQPHYIVRNAKRQGVAEGYREYDALRDRIDRILIKAYNKYGTRDEIIDAAKPVAMKAAQELGAEKYFDEVWLNALAGHDVDTDFGDNDNDFDYTDHSMRKGERGVEEGTKETTTGRVHKAEPGGYGRRDDDDGKKKEKTAEPVKRGRGRPKKDADSETGEVKNWDTDTLQRWIVGSVPKKLPGKANVKHKIKDEPDEKMDESMRRKQTKEMASAGASSAGAMAVAPMTAKKKIIKR